MDESDESHITENQSQKFQEDVKTINATILLNDFLISFIFQESGAKKGSLDSLSKEELISRCKSLLQLAQKAKNAKDGRWLP